MKKKLIEKDDKINPFLMEDYFLPGIKTKPAVFVGSQTSKFIYNDPEEQAWEGFYLGAARPGDVVVVRDIDPVYLSYWSALVGVHDIINLENENSGEFLTNIILNNQEIMERIKKRMQKNATLMVFFPTKLEEKLATQLGILLHGSEEISQKYGIKSGIRTLAEKAGIPMPPGYICHTLSDIETALQKLGEHFEEVIIKHDASFSGYFSKKMRREDFRNYHEITDQISGGKFTEGVDVVVVEGWVKSKASLCAHIEILPGKDPIICSAWQQIIDSDGISYIGGGPLILSKHAFSSFISYTKKLSVELQKEGAIGSFGPDFLITTDDQQPSPDSAFLIELNARIPYTAVPLEIVKDVRGGIGSGFMARHMHVRAGTTFAQVAQVLKENNLLITKKNKHARGAVPYNVGLLRWGIYDVVLMADSWDEVLDISETLTKISRF